MRFPTASIRRWPWRHSAWQSGGSARRWGWCFIRIGACSMRQRCTGKSSKNWALCKACPGRASPTTMQWQKISSAVSNVNWYIWPVMQPVGRRKIQFFDTLRAFIIRCDLILPLAGYPRWSMPGSWSGKMSHEHTGAIRRFIRLLCAFSCLFYREGGTSYVIARAYNDDGFW